MSVGQDDHDIRLRKLVRRIICFLVGVLVGIVVTKGYEKFQPSETAAPSTQTTETRP